MSEPIIPKNWSGGESDDEWRCEIEHDLMDVGEPLVVTVYVEEYTDGKRTSDALACASPQQAREMADALHVYAFEAERETAAAPSTSKHRPLPRPMETE